MIFVGDTFEQSQHAWVPGKVTSVVKSHKREFSGDLSTRGFYWRVVARCDAQGVPAELAFSTTEPRVLLHADFRHLLGGFETDLHYLAMYCSNSIRDWPPIWMLERGVERSISHLPFARWLLRDSLHPELRALRAW